MKIETPRLILRRWKEKDRAPFAALNADEQVMQFLGAPLTREQSDEGIDRQLKRIDAGEPAFWAAATKHDDQCIGFIGVKYVDFDAPFMPCYEIGWRIARAHWQKGYATEGAKAALKFAFENWKMPAIYSFAVATNHKSEKVMQKIGMTRVFGGEFNHPSFHDDDPMKKHILYSVQRQERPFS